MTSPRQLGPYVILDELGAGGMGTVHLGRHHLTGQVVAVKILPAALAREEGFVLRFDREIEALRRVENPHIVRLYDSGTADGTPYYAMEYVDGETLAQRVMRERRVPWRTAVQWGIELCSALKAAHDAGVIHRDLKPSNILIGRDGHIKLTDFGVAQVFASDRLTATGGVIGTAEYMSPEQALGQRATKRSDLYSLGAVLYVMLVGRPPFSGPSPVDVLQKQKFGRFDPPRAYVPDLPSWLDELVLQLLEKSPDDRPPDAYVLSRRLQEVVAKVDLRESGDSGFQISTPTIGVTAEKKFEPSHDAAAGGQGTLMRNLVREAIRNDVAAPWWTRLFDHPLVLVLLLILLVAFVLWMQPQKLSDEQRLASALKALDQPASSEWSRVKTELLLPLLEANPETWSAKVTPLLQEIELYELEADLIPSRRRSGRRGQKSSEIERQLLIARRLWDGGDLVTAKNRLQNLRVLFANQGSLSASDQRAMQLAERWRLRLEEELKDDASNIVAVRESLTRLLQQPHETHSAQAAARALIDLYSSDPRYTTLVDEARQLLTEAADQTTTDPAADHPAPGNPTAPRQP